MNNQISRLQDAICRLTECSSKYVETVAVTESFHGFRGEVQWQRDVAVFDIESHPKIRRVYAWTNKDPDDTVTHVIVLETPPVDSARTAIAAAMAASIVNGNFEGC